MIVQDQTETRKNNRVQINATVSPILEEVTGADFLISPVDNLPVTTEALIKLHIKKGAVLIQRKSLRDLVESTRFGIKSSLARMQDAGAAWWQCCVLASGVFLPNSKTGNVKVGMPVIKDTGAITFLWQQTNVKYSAFVAAKRRFPWRGGYIEILSCDDEILSWLKGAERDIKSLSENPIKEIYQPLQKIDVIKDARTVLGALDGIGPMRATQLWDGIKKYNKAMSKENSNPNLGQMLVWATMEEPRYYNVEKYHPWSSNLRAKVRAQIPLQGDQDLAIRDKVLDKVGYPVTLRFPNDVKVTSAQSVGLDDGTIETTFYSEQELLDCLTANYVLMNENDDRRVIELLEKLAKGSNDPE
jgi:hypothetical protein